MPTVPGQGLISPCPAWAERSGGLNHGRIDIEQVRTVLAGLSLPRFDGGRLVLAVDVSPWLRSDAPCSAERLFCHVYGRAKTASQFIPGWPYSFVAVPEPGATSWTAILDAVRSDRWTTPQRSPPPSCGELLNGSSPPVSGGPGGPDIVIVSDADYDVTRLAWVLRDLPVELVGRSAPTASCDCRSRLVSTTRRAAGR